MRDPTRIRLSGQPIVYVGLLLVVLGAGVGFALKISSAPRPALPAYLAVGRGVTQPTKPPSRPTAKTLPTSSTTTSPPPTTTSIVPATSGTSGGQQTTFVSNVPNVRIEDDRGRESEGKSAESVTGTADRETGDN